MMLRTVSRLGVAALAIALIPDAVTGSPGSSAGAGREVVYEQHGKASWYGPGFHGRKTASGERFNQHRLTAAHRNLPLGTEVTVTNLENGRSVQVEINDRGPYVRNRVIDLSKAAARQLDMVQDGTVPVRIQVTAVQMQRPENT